MLIYLIGFMGAGKSTVGRLLAKRLSYDFLDTDVVFATENSGVSTAEYIRRHGLEAFRPLEQKTLHGIASLGRNAVVATGAGVSVYADNLEVMKNSGWVVHLHTPLEAIEARMTPEELEKRPVWTKQSREALQKCYEERLLRYNQAHCTIDGTQKPETIVSELIWRYRAYNEQSGCCTTQDALFRRTEGHN